MTVGRALLLLSLFTIMSVVDAGIEHCPEVAAGGDNGGLCVDGNGSPVTSIVIAGPADKAECFTACRLELDALGCQFDTSDDACKKVTAAINDGDGTTLTGTCWDFSECRDFLLVSDTKNFADAKTYCGGWGGFLATVPDVDVNAKLSAALPGTITKAWIGKTDVAAQTTFKWVNTNDASFDSYDNWDSAGVQQPDGVDQDGIDCAAIITSGTWTDENCGDTNAFFCSRVQVAANVLAYCPVEAGSCVELAGTAITDGAATDPAAPDTKEECLALCRADPDAKGCEYDTSSKACKSHGNVNTNKGDGSTANKLCWVFSNCKVHSAPIDTKIACNEKGFVPTFTYDNIAGKVVNVDVKIGGTGRHSSCESTVDVTATDTAKQLSIANFGGGEEYAYKGDPASSGTPIVACLGEFANWDDDGTEKIKYEADVAIVLTETIGSIERKLKYNYQIRCELHRDVESISTEGAGGKWTIDNTDLQAAAVSKDVVKSFELATSLEFYTNAAYDTKQAAAFTALNNEQIYIKVSEDDSGNDLFVFTVEECWATAGVDAAPTGADQAAKDAKKDVFFTNQCGKDSTVKFTHDFAAHWFKLNLLSFYFKDHTASEIYFHCTLKICLESANCVQKTQCTEAKRKRRSVGGVVETRTITSKQHLVLNMTEMFPPTCAPGYVYDRVSKECSNERLLEVNGIHLDIVWNPLYADTSSKVFREFAREKEYQLFAILQATGRDGLISGVKVIGATKGSVVLVVQIKYAESTYAEYAFREFEAALVKTRRTTTRVMSILNVQQDKTIEYVPIVVEQAPGLSMENMVLIIVVAVLLFVVLIFGITLYKVKQMRRGSPAGNPIGFENKGVDA